MLDSLSSTRPNFAGQVSTPATEIPTVTGRYLAHARLTASERAGIAAAYQLGELRLEHPTEKQVAETCRATRAYVRKARRATPEQRRQLAQGQRTIRGLGRSSKNGSKNGKAAPSWGSLTDSALEAAVREAGVARVWDAITRIID